MVRGGMTKDTIFSERAEAGSFIFDQRVAAVFDDMVSRSVPGYQAIQLLIADLAVTFSSNNRIYDLGCSTGATIKAISTRAKTELLISAIDNSPEMLSRCKQNVSELPNISVNLHCLDFVSDDPFIDGVADVVILNLALQFVRPVHRQDLLRKCYNHTTEGGVMLLVEKTIEADKVLNGFYVEYYHRFKREMGYSDMEIASKREALENVLIPYQREENIALLKEAGYRHVSSFFQWFNFSGFIAIK